ncbi:transcriptional regulator, AraC family [Nocardia nova SH22a]|uniref:Transcriptional regulator, AraC family n=1 Tax=Nocardia nova SH22a TaxID=1415166 RepID=W5TDF3_9NOCA|nr:helix-turn-helix domain-containing protein [Nocardia nova]AHH17003.1 transcriptional regulator, AraC family [Nocardia nova SH22a]
MTTGRDRLRELLDAVLDENNTSLGAMAEGAFASPYHFARQISRGTGEAPVAMRRRVLLERAAWQLSGGATVTEVAFAAGYESVEGFSRAYHRAFGHPPSATGTAPRTRWLPAVNGIHFHPPMSLWVESEPRGRHDMDPTSLLLHHDVADTRELLSAALDLSAEQFRRRRANDAVPAWDGPDDSIAAVLDHLIRTKEVWLAAIAGADQPDRGGNDPAELLRRFDAVAPRWLDAIREIDRRGGWGDTLIDALCEPPESFVLGSVVAHVLTYSAYRRLLARRWIASETPGESTEHDNGDPIMWLRTRG